MRAKNLFLITVLSLASCQGNSYHQVKGGEFTVNYLDKSIIEEATSLANYWKDHSLISEQKQDIELERNGDTWVIKLIANNPSDQMSFEEQRLMTELATDISQFVFQGEYVSLHICNNKFETLFTVNE